MMASPTSPVILPPATAARIRDLLARFHTDRLLPRLFDKDPTLWSRDPAEQRTIRERLGWLSILPAAMTQIADFITFADEVRRDGFTHAVLLGMGGSSLFQEVCR